MDAKLQVALDFLEMSRALVVAREAVAGGAHWIEAGTPLIKSEGLDAVRILREEFPDHTIIADMKTMDAGRTEMESAAKAGASVAVVLAAASESTIRECVEAGRNYGFKVQMDLVSHPDPVRRAAEAANWGVDIIGVHCPIDAQMQGADPFEVLRAVRSEVDCMLSVAGGLHAGSVRAAVEEGADVVIVGGAVAKAPDAEAAVAELIEVMGGAEPPDQVLYRRAGAEDELRALLAQVSTPNLSDAMHRSGELVGMASRLQGASVQGRAVTVRTAAGDWAKPVEAIDQAKAGDILVVDAGGRTPAVWGELASESCVAKGISAVVIDGAVRDLDAIRAIGFPAWSSHVCATAGEPKGFGEIGVAVTIGGTRVEHGDWIVADDSGVVRLPRTKALEVGNRAMDVLEHENRLREEIRRGSTLSVQAELPRWEKR